MSVKILLVDDEPDVLAGYYRVLRKQYDIQTAEGGSQALQILNPSDPPSVVVSDFNMPEMNGIAFLTEVRSRCPDSVRIMLTGNTDLESAMQAVNEGNVFRFLTKPCPVENLMRALDAGIEQHRLIRAEKELLENTVRGAVKTLSDILALVHPGIFGRVGRVRRIVSDLAKEFHEEKRWQWEIAAMLSLVGCVTLSSGLLDKIRAGTALTNEETAVFLNHPEVGAELISNIPRLEVIADIVAHQEKNFDGSGPPKNGKCGEDIPLGARVLHAVLSYDRLMLGGLAQERALSQMQSTPGAYDPRVFTALCTVLGVPIPEQGGRNRGTAVSEPTSFKMPYHLIHVSELKEGMVLAEDVRMSDGILLLGRGQEVTATLTARLKNLAAEHSIKGVVKIETV